MKLTDVLLLLSPFYETFIRRLRLRRTCPYGEGRPHTNMWPCTTCQALNENSANVCAQCGTEKATEPKKLETSFSDQIDDALKKRSETRKTISTLQAASPASRRGKRTLGVRSKAPPTSPVSPLLKHGVCVLPTELTKETNDSKKEEESQNDFSDVEKYGIIETAGNDSLGRKIVVFSACRLPPKGKCDHKRLLMYIRATLKKNVQRDYVIVCFNFGFTDKNKPTPKWLAEAYDEFDRKYRKNLKVIYLVHPSNYIKTVRNAFKPFISAKFAKKMLYVNYLIELKDHLDLDQLSVPQEVIEYDAKAYDTLENGPLKTQQFGVSLQYIKECSGTTVPVVVERTIEYLKDNGLRQEGIFRKSAVATTLTELKKRYNEGKTVEFSPEGYDVNAAAGILKTFLRELQEPILTFDLFEPVTKLTETNRSDLVLQIERMLREKLPEDNYNILKYIVQFLKEVSSHSEVNKMTPENLATVFGPNLLWSKGQDSQFIMESINSFVCILINNFDEIFTR